MHNFIAYFRKGGDFLKPFWAKWPRKQVAFFHGRTVKEAESNIFTCKPCSIFKTLGLIRLSRILSHTNHENGNSKAFTCKLRDNTTHNKVLITWAWKAMPMNSVLPVFLFFAWLIPLAARQGWLLGSFHPDPGITILGSPLTGLARLSYNRKVDFCCV